MATSTDVPIYTTTLGSTTASVTIDLSTYQQYKNLKIVATASRGITGSGAADFNIRFNGDSGSNYSSTLLFESPGSAKVSNQSSLTWGGTVGDNNFMLNTLYIMNYTSTAMYKSTLGRFGSAADGQVRAATGLWRSNSAITTITMTPTNGFGAGTTISVYGIGSASTGAKATGGAVYSDSTYMYHVFNNTAAFVPSQNLTADILVVGGGGGGGGTWYGPTGGGGGAGGYLTFANQSLTSGTSYTCTVGGGGTFATSTSNGSTNGSNSQFGALTAAVGGGRGGEFNSGTSGGNGVGGNGGSGGGGGGNGSGSGRGLASPTGQGNNGGLAYTSGAGGGGGGAGGVGADSSAYADNSNGGNGGVGLSTAISGGYATGAGHNVSGIFYFAGGGAGGRGGTGTPGTGGLGGGGNGGLGTGTRGMQNTGGGGGGGGNGEPQLNGSPGGSGIIIVRYAK